VVVVGRNTTISRILTHPMPTTIQRRFVDPAPFPADANIRPQYAIQSAHWVWHPDHLRDDQPVALTFTRTFTLDQPSNLTLHLSADERYEATLDGQHLSAGPHRCDVARWTFASFDLTLDPGPHTLAVRAWALGKLAPEAQITHAPGCILAVEQMPELNTGQPGWTVVRDTTRCFTPYPNTTHEYHVVGPEETVDPKAQPAPTVEPVPTANPVKGNDTGIRVSPRGLYPSPLPEMIRQPRRPGRAVALSNDADPIGQSIDRADTARPELADWQAMLDGNAPLTLPPDTTLSVIIDPDDYLCAYPVLELTGGADATVAIQWAEALYEVDNNGNPTKHKNQRDAVVGKRFVGPADYFVGPGPADQPVALSPLWWQAGRMIRLTVRTGDQPLTLHGLALHETRYPLEDESTWASNDDSLNATLPPMVRTLQMCAHETYMDCPFYEQMMYVGDTRLEMLVAHVTSLDDRLNRRGIDLFDSSRLHTGLVAERYPSRALQQSTTFAMVWVKIVEDFARWRNAPDFIQQKLVGVRNLLDNILPLRHADGLLHALPGWSFVDWVPDWHTGYPPAAREGKQPSSILNLHLVQALRAAAQLEQWHGEPELAARYTRLANDLAARITDTFYDPDRHLLKDDPTGEHYSEHAQCLALLNNALPDDLVAPTFESLITADDLHRCTVYFSHYLLDTFALQDRGDLLVDYLDRWKRFPREGFRTIAEKPEPSRSDCHAWGSHPLYHMHASIAGVRPDGPGFQRVAITPRPGNLTHIQATTPHPNGPITTDLDVTQHTATITLPPNLPGTFTWHGKAHPLHPGQTQTINLE